MSVISSQVGVAGVAAAGVLGKKSLEAGFSLLAGLIKQRYSSNAEVSRTKRNITNFLAALEPPKQAPQGFKSSLSITAATLFNLLRAHRPLPSLPTSAQLLRLKDDLQVKLRMLAFPMDLCAQRATQGNSALQDALDVALLAVHEVDSLFDSFEQEKVEAARDPASLVASSPDMNAQALAKRLQALIAVLDSVVPYLILAINASVLLGGGTTSSMGGGGGGSAVPRVSLTRSMQASWRLRTAVTCLYASLPMQGEGLHGAQGDAGGGSMQPLGVEAGQGWCNAVVLEVPNVTWYEKKATRSAAGTVWTEVYPRATLRVVAALPQKPEESGTGMPQRVPGVSTFQVPRYSLTVLQNLDDGRHHDEDEIADQLTLEVDCIASVGWLTGRAMGHGAHNYSPALQIVARRHSSRTPTGRVEGGGIYAVACADVASFDHGSTPEESDIEEESSENNGARSEDDDIDGTSPLAAAPSSEGSFLREATPTGQRIPGPDTGTLRENTSPARFGHENVHPDAAEGVVVTPEGAPGLVGDWEVLGEVDHLLRLCMVEASEGDPHYVIRDERLLLLMETFGDIGSTNNGSTNVQGITTPGGAVQSENVAGRHTMTRTTPAGTTPGSTSSVASLAQQLGKKLSVQGGGEGRTTRSGRGFGSPMQ